MTLCAIVGNPKGCMAFSVPRLSVEASQPLLWIEMSADGKAANSRRKKSVAEEQVTSILKGGDIPVYTRELDADEEVLAALGYRPEFKREFSLWTTFCVSFAVLGLLPSFAATLYYVSLCSRRAGPDWR